MISENEAKVLKTDTDFIIYCCVSLKKIKNIINYLNEELNFIKNNFIRTRVEMRETALIKSYR